ncbi:MAG TPA: serine/threonine-protein kinase, partial [Actinomycetes bacterium]|nr:serine/threonine-protein kinase [Actinomycetes bacterium]
MPTSIKADRTQAAGGDVAALPGLTRGDVFAGLEIESEIGRGGMGIVYRARDPTLERLRALKVLPPEHSADPDFRERFRRESRLAARVEHPNVATIHRAGEEDGRLYLVMRLIDGESLEQLLARKGCLDPARAADLIAQLAAALDAAHERGLIHRDVKPANVLLEGPEGSERAVLCDFGITRLAAAATELTATGEFIGTVDYVAPEQIAGEA